MSAAANQSSESSQELRGVQAGRGGPTPDTGWAYTGVGPGTSPAQAPGRGGRQRPTDNRQGEPGDDRRDRVGRG